MTDDEMSGEIAQRSLMTAVANRRPIGCFDEQGVPGARLRLRSVLPTPP